MASNTSIPFEATPAYFLSFSPSNDLLPVLFIGLFIVYHALHRVYKIFAGQRQSPPATVDNHRTVVASMVGDPRVMTLSTMTKLRFGSGLNRLSAQVFLHSLRLLMTQTSMISNQPSNVTADLHPTSLSLTLSTLEESAGGTIHPGVLLLPAHWSVMGGLEDAFGPIHVTCTLTP